MKRMSAEELLAACSAAGYRVDTAAGTIDGMAEGIAFRATLPRNTLAMSVSISEKNLPKLEKKLAAFGPAGLTVTYHNAGLLLTIPSMDSMEGQAFQQLLTHCASAAAALAGASFEDKFEKDRESPLPYLRGALGAFLGAVVGILPWFLVEQFLHWRFWYLGALIGVASFYGYRYLWGAHSTRFAMASVIVSSLLVVLLLPVVRWVAGDLAVLGLSSFGDIVSYYVSADILPSILRESLFGLLACGAGLFGIRGRVLSYTHESVYMRRNGRKK